MLFCTNLVVRVNIGYFSAFERVSTADSSCFFEQSKKDGKETSLDVWVNVGYFSAFERVSAKYLHARLYQPGEI